MRFILLTLCITSFLTTTKAQRSSINANMSIGLNRATDEIKIDGILNESSWQNIDSAFNFHQNFPYDTSLSNTKTVVRLLYDDNFLYVSAICYDNKPNKRYVIQSLKRDFSVSNTDAFTLSLDPSLDLTNGYNFGVNPYGVQREGILFMGGTWGVTTVWDQVWYSACTRHGDYWIAEIAIPFKSIRYTPNNLKWGVNFSRHDQKNNEVSTWAPVPRNFNISSLAYAGVMEWKGTPPQPGKNLVIAPYVINNNAQSAANKNISSKPNIGLDLRTAVTPSLNLDVTINPDFAQVEVDRQVTNLTRFSLFFPEQRTFFQENSDLFSNFGFSTMRPFFSRRIGLYSPLNGATRQVPILGGARLSGKLNSKLRVGLMNIQTRETELADLDTTFNGQNYTTFAFQKDVFKGSNFGLIFVNRQATNKTNFIQNDFNRILGFDYNLASQNNLWRGKFFIHKAFTPDKKTDQVSHAVFLMYNTPKLVLMWNHEFMGTNYIAETGFTPRLSQYDFLANKNYNYGYFRIEPSITKTIYPKSALINSYSFSLYNSTYWFRNWELNDFSLNTNSNVAFQNSASGEIGVNFKSSNLIKPFVIGDTLLPGLYSYNDYYLNFKSNVRKIITWNLSYSQGGYYNGNRLGLRAGASVRFQQYGSFGVDVNREELKFLSRQNANIYWLVSPRVDLTFSKNLFFTTFVQYNEQSNNMNINSRLQWRYRPMSDLFIVYSDNYGTPNLPFKNRALAVKLIYWLGV